MRRYLGVCYVLHEPGDATIIGYYTLSAFSIEPTSLPPSLATPLGHYPLLPATLIGRLAVDLRFQGEGVGAFLLTDALRRSFRAADRGVASMAVVVDAIDDRAGAFYERFEFQRFEDNRQRLYLPMSKVQEMFQGGS